MTTEELRAMPVGDSTPADGMQFVSADAEYYWITRVPGGWLFNETFVPDPLERAAVEIAAGICANDSWNPVNEDDVRAGFRVAAEIARAVLEEVGK